MLNCVLACFLGAANVLLSWLSLPVLPAGQMLDLSKFELTWSDEFDGDSLDLKKWNGHGFSQGAHKRRDGYWSLELADVRDGRLHIPSVWLEEGIDGGPPGYYSLGIDTRNAFRQKYGYFEVRAKLPRGEGLWSAFWLYNDMVGSVESSPQKGTEVDIFESPYYREGWPKRNAVASALHYYEGGYQGTLHSQGLGPFWLRKPYDTFNTYGLEWNKDEYIFYINGRETGRSSFGGVCQAELYVILSVEHQLGGWAGDIGNNAEMTDFVIDYVRVYQYKEVVE